MVGWYLLSLAQEIPPVIRANLTRRICPPVQIFSFGLVYPIQIVHIRPKQERGTQYL